MPNKAEVPAGEGAGADSLADRMGRVIKTDRTLHIEVGDGAAMTVPAPEWLWQLRYAREPNRGPTICDDRMIAAGALESYLYLIQECTKEEFWRRIKLLRAALRPGSGRDG